ncbi:LacI family DNA-binding transcriptional regulator, partial [Actinomyces sp.]|uniref:LacI family DNA-binding transcriptional regulator n=1 Tax=Actinomyces sp. TaxID=29317 RepID=UPI0026DBA63B
MARTPRGHSQVTIGDVARLAGVSRATASRALNDSDKVVPATKQRVRAAADKIGFVMNARARGLALGRAEAIAILFTEPLNEMFADPTYATLVRGIHEALAPTSTMPVLMQASSDFERARVLQRFRQR